MKNQLSPAPLPLSRRAVLSGSLAVSLVGLTGMGRARAGDPLVLTAQSGTTQVLEQPGAATSTWSYDGRTPGPVIRVRHGDPVRVRLKNALDVPTTVHWHGVRITNAMDGVARLTQQPVPPGGTFDYDFTPPEPGTYWYHPHNKTWEQLARGLYGFLIVDEKAPPKVDRDLLLAFDDWRITETGRIHEQSFGALHDWSHGGRLGNHLTLNGEPFLTIPAKQNERVRLRLLNVSNARVLKLSFANLAPKVIAVDGQPIAPDSGYATTFELAPAQRLDLIADLVSDPGSEVLISEVSTREPVTIGKFVLDEKEVARGEPLVAPIALPAADIPKPEPKKAKRFPLVMEGGAMGGLREATLNGETLSLRTLALQHRKVWAFNGKADGMDLDAPLFRVPRGSHVIVDMDNRSAWPHAMHVHGHHFKIIERSIRDLDPHWWDTILMEPREKMSIGFVADNPGKWMLHCHMLEHQAAGMGTWFEVV